MNRALLAIGILALSGLTGCGLWDRIVEPPKPAVVMCHCTAPALRGAVAPAATVHRVAQRTRHHTYRRYAYRSHSYRHHTYRRYAMAGSYRAHGYHWHRRYAERSMDIYDYSSASSHYGHRHYGYHGEMHYGVHEGAHEGEGAEGGGQFSGSTRVWADGYGRRHIYDQSAVRHYVYQAHVRAAQSKTRLDPWHGYNDDWDD